MDLFDYYVPTPAPQARGAPRLPERLLPLLKRPLYRPDTSEEDPGLGPLPLPTYESLIDAISILLKYLQGYHRIISPDHWVIWFPFEIVALKADTRVFMERGSQSGVYKVKDPDNKFIGVYRLETAGQAPQASDILYTSDENRLRFHVGYPAAEDVNTYFTDQQLEQNKAEPWSRTITYRILRVEPAGSKDYFGGTKDITKKSFGAFKYENGIVAEVFGQRFDLEVQFDCWDQTNEGAVDVVRWFRNAMKLAIPVLRGHGVEQAHFWEQKQDVHVTRWRNDIIARSVVYRFRILEGELIRRGTIDELDVRVAAQDDGELAAELQIVPEV